MKNANQGAIDNAQLKSIVERIEKLNEDMASIAADVKEIYSEAKSAGYDPKYIKKCIELRKKDQDQIEEEDELLQRLLYPEPAPGTRLWCWHKNQSCRRCGKW